VFAIELARPVGSDRVGVVDVPGLIGASAVCE
jgi:hypothetical protein